MQLLSKTFIAILFFSMSACAFNVHRVPTADIPFAKAAYTIDGSASEKACNTYVLGIAWGSVFRSKTGARSGGTGIDSVLQILGLGSTLEERQAFYAAMEKMPGSTHAMEPRVEQSFSGLGGVSFPFIGQRCAELRVTAVTLGDVNPQQ